MAGAAGPEMLAKLTEGVWLSDGKVRAKRARIVGRQGQATWLELVLAEGKKREIRRMLSKLGHKVMSLSRIAVGPISLKGLSVGEARPLSRHEIDLLRRVAAGMSVSPAFGDESSPARDRGPRREHNRPRTQAAESADRTRAPRPPGVHAGAGSRHGRPRRSPHPHDASKSIPARRPDRPHNVKPARPAKRKPGDVAGVDAAQPVLTPVSPQPARAPRIIIGLEPGPKSQKGAAADRAGKRQRPRPPVRRQRPARLPFKKPSDLPSEPGKGENQEP